MKESKQKQIEVNKEGDSVYGNVMAKIKLVPIIFKNSKTLYYNLILRVNGKVRKVSLELSQLKIYKK